MGSLLEELKRSTEAGELEEWKAALFAAWLRTERGSQGERPSANDLAALLRDAETVMMLKHEAPSGPWDILSVQAGSIKSHESVGDWLNDLAEAIAPSQ